MARKPYPSDVTDDEWIFVAPCLTLMREDAPQRGYDLRDVFNALRWIVRAGSPWRYMANDLPPWEVVYQRTQRWIRAGVFEAMVHDLRELLRMVQGRPGGGLARDHSPGWLGADDSPKITSGYLRRSRDCTSSPSHA
jgi:transposase